jgi:dipeptidyl aminopeptidase/acylaminoacyl peptidase
VREVPQYTIDDFLQTTSIRGAAFSPDESHVLFSSDASGIFNAYSVPVTGGEPTQLTHSTSNSIYAQSFFPEDERILYESDQGGNELTHVYVRELDGSIQDLTPGEKLKAGFLDWAHDRRSFFVETNERDKRYFDLYEYTPDGYGRTLVFQNEEGYELGPFSRDGRWLALTKTPTRDDRDVYLYDRSTQALRHLTPHEGSVIYAPQEFTADGQGLYMITDEGEEFRYLVRQDLETNAREVVEKPGWDVWFARLSESGRYLAVGINHDARTEIRLQDLQEGKPVTLPDLPEGDITTLVMGRSEERLAFHLNGSRSPSNLYVHNLVSGDVQRLTNTLNAKIDAANLVDARVVRFTSYDGVEIPGLLYRPWNASPDHVVPALVWVHGGPGGQSRVGYNPLIQYLVNGGYAVFAINNRGSSGYGKTFFQMDDQKHGDADLDDCVASKQFLIDQGWVDPPHIGIIGGSYGGYMVLAALTFRPEAFAVGIDLFGISNWVRTLESIPKWWEAQRQALYLELGNPETDREALLAKSPLFHADQIVKPLMVLQGANDPRVIQVESDDIVAAARKNGVPVEYLVFDDEGHGFRKKENQRRGYAAIRDFCDLHLRAETPSSTYSDR